MNGIYKKYLHEAMGWMFFRNELMKKLSLKSGFYEFYSDILSLNNDSTMAFQEANKIYKDLFGSFRFESYADFYKSYSVENTKNCIEAIQRNFLLLHFKEKGFGTWESFSPLVLHYYPIVGVTRLKAFYNGTSLDKEVIKFVDFVRQIIG
jgi:hypothetical protein